MVTDSKIGIAERFGFQVCNHEMFSGSHAQKPVAIIHRRFEDGWLRKFVQL